MSDEWWGRPYDARRYHIFEGDGLAESLCGNWGFTNDGAEPEVSDDDGWRDGKDCKECCRQAGLLNE